MGDTTRPPSGGEQYYAARPTSPTRPATVRLPAGQQVLTLSTGGGVFSRTRLDPGTRLLLKALEPVLPQAHTLLDLGCGYGPIGLWAAASFPHLRVVLTDINERAVALCRRNISDNGLNNRAVALLGEGYQPVGGQTFDVIATNPPIRAGMAVLTSFVAGAPDHLAPGGSLFLVARTSQGARTLARLMREHFHLVEEVAKGGGYRVYRAREPQIGGS